MPVIGALAKVESGAEPPIPATLVFQDTFTETGSSLVSLFDHKPNIDQDGPAGDGWLGSNSAFSIRKDLSNEPSGLGSGVAGDQNQGQGVVCNHGIDTNKRIIHYLGNDGNIGTTNPLYQGIIVRHLYTSPLDIHKASLFLSVRRDSGLAGGTAFAFYDSTFVGLSGGTWAGSGAQIVGTVATSSLSMNGNWLKFIIEDVGGTLTAWIEGDEGNTAVADTPLYAGSTYAGMLRLEDTGNPSNKFRNDFEVYSI